MIDKNHNGLRYPSIDELLNKIKSKYRLAYTAAKIARAIKRDEIPLDALEDCICNKPVSKALELIIKDDRIINY